MKIHLKYSRADHLALCKKRPKNSWTLEEAAQRQATEDICKVCCFIAVRRPERPTQAEN